MRDSAHALRRAVRLLAHSLRQVRDDERGLTLPATALGLVTIVLPLAIVLQLFGISMVDQAETMMEPLF